MINADDFYGREAFVEMAKVLKEDRTGRYCMAGYILDNTLTDNGSVARGICETENGKLVSIEEHTKIYREGELTFCACEGEPHPVDRYSVVSMNFFGFGSDVFKVFKDESKPSLMKREVNSRQNSLFLSLFRALWKRDFAPLTYSPQAPNGLVSPTPMINPLWYKK